MHLADLRLPPADEILRSQDGIEQDPRLEFRRPAAPETRRALPQVTERPAGGQRLDPQDRGQPLLESLQALAKAEDRPFPIRPLAREAPLEPQGEPRVDLARRDL